MTITDLLRGEHGALHAQLDRVEAMLLDGRSVEEVRWRAAELLFSLRSHARIEETLLMEPVASTAPEGARCREEIEEEHAEIDGLLDQATGEEDLPSLVYLLRRAVALARGHFSREEHIVFPLAEALIDDAELKRLGRCWADRRRVYIPNAGGDQEHRPKRL